MKRYALWIDGAEVPPGERTWHTVTAPNDASAVHAIAECGFDDVQRAVAAARRAAPAWRDRTAVARGGVLARVAARLRADADALAAVEARESGVSVWQGAREIEHAAAYFDLYASLAGLPPGAVTSVGSGRRVYTQREPFGVIAVLTSAHAAAVQIARSLAPALAAGNTVVLKPPQTASVIALRLARTATACGLPDGVLNVVTGAGRAVVDALTGHPEVRKISFAGSSREARAIGTIAADQLVPFSLELSGSSCVLVFADAAIRPAVSAAVDGLIDSAGRLPAASTRLIVADCVHDEVVRRVADAVAHDPRVRQCMPAVSAARAACLHAAAEAARSEGASLVAGGGESGPHGRLGPTILTDVTPDMRVAVADHSTPVLAVMRFERAEEAVALANDAEHCCVASVWTSRTTGVEAVVSRLEATHVYVNTWDGNWSGRLSDGGWTRLLELREQGIEAMYRYTRGKHVAIDCSGAREPAVGC
ncbi:aldehyde dehydrogenase [Streptomyces sulfonofaciens]|uniref:Aldehyde dehydrogenase n=1 Tax=Streptomyces sulfonofaciens TaxID=68272 RepID=A0A919L762_9ACTN|nr:aldehyde dehydrogenase family protein [Streptomyces sulfonofaciens]GHH86457.1 aldehyde dehydrogenase [Streptomyces sulfonofaciens]